MLHRQLVVVLLLDDIQVTFRKRKLSHFMKYQSEQAADVPSVQETSVRVDLSLNCIGLPALSGKSSDERKTRATTVKAKEGEISERE